VAARQAMRIRYVLRGADAVGEGASVTSIADYRDL
jgi:hypothetical protein